MIIYKATNKINNKIYIGQTTNTLQYRANQHFREAKREDRPNTYFHNAIEKYGFENFTFEVIDSANIIDELNLKEQYWIRFYDSTNKQIGYNLDSGGVNCFKSARTKRKIGDTTLQKWQNPDTAKRMREGLEKATKVWSNNCKDRKVVFVCPRCGKVLMLVKWEAKNKKFCSAKCGGYSENTISNLKQIGKEKHLKNLSDKKELGYEILQWCRDNSDIIMQCPYNKITTNLEPMLVYFGIKDIRNIFLCFNVSSRKELLKYLKDYLIKENIC